MYILYILLFQYLAGKFLSASCVTLVVMLFISEDKDCVKTWNDLRLSLHGKKILLSHACLSANHITAVHSILKWKFPNQNGLQDTSYLKDKIMWRSSVEKFVQIINVSGHHWVCVSNNFSWKENTADMRQSYDSTK